MDEEWKKDIEKRIVAVEKVAAYLGNFIEELVTTFEKALKELEKSTKMTVEIRDLEKAMLDDKKIREAEKKKETKKKKK